MFTSMVLFVLFCLFLYLKINQNHKIFSKNDITASNTTKENNISADLKNVLKEYNLPVYKNVPVVNTNDIYLYKADNANYTIINYFSLDCIHCQNFWNSEKKNILKYSKNLNMVYRQTTLKSEPLSFGKAMISECLRQDTNNIVYFKFIDKVFSSGNYFKTQKNNEWVKKIALTFIRDEKKFNECMDNENLKETLKKQKSEELLLGIEYIPTLLIFNKDNELIKMYNNVSNIGAIKILDFYSASN